MPSPFYVSESQTSPAPFSPQTHTFFSRNIYPLVLRSDLRNHYTINVDTPTQYFSHGFHHYSTYMYLVFVFLYNQLNILLVILHLASPLRPSPVFSGLTPPVFYFYQLLLSLYLLLQWATTPSPPRTYNVSSQCAFLQAYFIVISLSNPNVFFHKCESNCSYRIKVYNITFDAETAESQFPLKIQCLNNYMFAKLMNIFSNLFNRD